MKKIFDSFLFVVIGVIVGSALVYGYYNFSSEAESRRLTASSAEPSQETDSEEPVEPVAVASAEGEAGEAAAYLRFKNIRESFIPSGVPAIYGEELEISFDDVQDAINKVRVYGPTYGTDEDKITLAGDDLQRFIDITSKTSCQYCCGAVSLINDKGEAACGCAHSIMMRGLAAYLVQNHPEMSNEQILKELNIWKISYFPKQTLSEELARRAKAGEQGIQQILEEFPDFLPQMVGGC